METKIAKALADAKVSLNEYYVLASALNTELKEFTEVLHVKAEDAKRKLIRRKFLNSDGSVTELGADLIGGKYEPKVVLVKTENEKVLDSFEEFWDTFPTSDKWGGFSKTRVLRADKPRALRLYKSALKEVTHEQLMSALHDDIQLKQKNSFLRNEMTFMPAICSWLGRRYYEGFLGETEKGLIQKPKFGEDVG